MESGYGKGAPDGIDGVIKRTTDGLVAKGKDIPDVDTLHKALLDANTAVKLHMIEESKITDTEQKIPKNIPSVRGIMKVHQVCTQNKHKILTEVVSCFCSWPTMCQMI